MGHKLKIIVPIAAVILTLATVEFVSSLILAANPPAPPAPSPTEIMSPSAFELPETFGTLPRYKLPEAVNPNYSVKNDFPWTDEKGLWLPPRDRSFKVHYTNAATGELLWETTNSTDAQGRRLAPWQDERRKTAKRHVFAAGCSLTWGHGVNDDETFLARISKNRPDLITYNAGVGGFSASEILARAMTTDVMDGITPRRGIGLYVFFEEHLPRFANTAFIVGTWRHNGMVMDETPDGRFEPRGPVDMVRPFFTAFSFLWAQSSFARLFGLDFPRIDDKMIDRFLREVKAYRQIYWEKTSPDNPFVVLIFPYFRSRALREGLTRAEIPFLDYGKHAMVNFTEKVPFIEGDGHPTPELHEKISIALERDLRAIMDAQAGKK